MKTVTFSYSGSVTPKATTYLKSQPMDMSYDSTADVGESDASHAKTIQAEFQSAMDKAIKAQLAFLNKWLEEKDALIANMVKRSDELKGAFPLTQQDAASYDKKVKELTAIAKELDQLPKEFQGIVNDWAANCRQQQGLIAMQKAVQKARVTTFENKSFRVKTGMAVKALLLVAGIALSIAAIVLTAGATAPIFVGLAATGIALSGIGGLGGIAKNIVENANTEKKLLSNVTKDVEAITNAFGGVKDKGASLKKHVTELSNLVKIREDRVRSLENDIKKYKVEAASYSKNVAALNAAPLVNTSKVKSNQKACDELVVKLNEANAKITALKADNQKAADLLKGLTDLGVELDKVSGQGPNTLLGNLKQRYTSVDGWLDLSNSLGSLSSGISSVHS